MTTLKYVDRIAWYLQQRGSPPFALVCLCAYKRSQVLGTLTGHRDLGLTDTRCVYVYSSLCDAGHFRSFKCRDRLLYNTLTVRAGTGKYAGERAAQLPG